ncbi:MAG TPA: alpha/beta hydrolase [Treponemataceae bacterium]|jgi:acetyl esterase/lipase|nr:alpha/beta hydrolase [Treponemataceae bacterium]HQB87644.1 alpha/beta hydrolase [Treponemataceae bacterium]
MIYESLDVFEFCLSQKITAPETGAVLTVFIPDNYDEIDPERKRPAVIICPGGCYEYTSVREAEPVALRFVALGMAAFVLNYSCSPAVYPTALQELAACVAAIRKKAGEWPIDAKQIAVCGFSAGAHLAASLGCLWNTPDAAQPDRSARPDALILSYPVITSGEFRHDGSFRALLGSDYETRLSEFSLENRVTGQTPPAFIWHTHDDDIVPMENSLLFASALRKNGVPFELHVYQPGGHGLSTATEETRDAKGEAVMPECENWMEMAVTWFVNNPNAGPRRW